MLDKNSNKKPFFSIIVPCYNSEKFLNYSIESIINQSFDSWELIAINDGSTDRTEAMLRAYSEKDDRIKVFSKQNGGYCSAVNLGLDNICGEYFTFMGSDDSLQKDLFEGVYNEICKTLPDMVGFRTNKIKDGEFIGVDGFTDFDTSVYENDTTIKEFQRTHAKWARIFSVRDTSKFYKTEILGELRYFGKYGFDADGIFAMLFAHKCFSFASLAIDGYNWTLRGDSLSGKKVTAEVYEDRLDNWMRFYKILKRLNRDDVSGNEKDYVDYYYEKAWNYAILIDDREKAKFLKKHTRFIYRTMRRYKITVGRNFSEKIKNYYSLLFPDKKIKSLRSK